MRKVINVGIRALSIICMLVTIFLILFADIILKDNTVYTFITTTSESIDMTFETDPLVIDGTNLNLMQGVKAISESGDDVTDLVDAMVVNENNQKVVMYSINDSRYNLENFKRGLELKNYKGPSISIKSADKGSRYTCDINYIDDFIYKLIVAKRIVAKDGYGNDISQNVYVDPSVQITEAGIHKVTVMVKNSFGDTVKNTVTIKITGELITDEVEIATEMTTIKRGNTSQPDRESETVASEGPTFDTSINILPNDNPTMPTAITQNVQKPPFWNKPTKPSVQKPTAPVEKPTAPTQKPTAPVEKPTAPVEKPTVPVEKPTEVGTAVIYFADDNKREPITVNVGDTFTYDVYLKLTEPKLQSFAVWTYFNQPVGTKKIANQAGELVIAEENQVLALDNECYTAYYSPFRENYDLMKASNHLIGFATGAVDESDHYQMIETDNGDFTQQGGCHISTITFTVQKAGEVEIFTRFDDSIVDFDNSELQAEYVAIYNEKVTEDATIPTEATEPTEPTEATEATEATEYPTEEATAIIHFADDNEREPITVKVGDTFRYNVYLKLADPKVHSFTTWTYFNQPLGTKNTANQAGITKVPQESQVLKLERECYTPYYSPFNANYDVKRFSNYLISYGIGNSNDGNSMVKTDNGKFTQQSGCRISTITFTVQKAGEVEVFTRLENAVVDSENKSDYVAIYNEYQRVDRAVEPVAYNLKRNSDSTLSDLTIVKKQVLCVDPTMKNNYYQSGVDVNNDGQYTLVDIILISRAILEMESKAV